MTFRLPWPSKLAQLCTKLGNLPPREILPALQLAFARHQASSIADFFRDLNEQAKFTGATAEYNLTLLFETLRPWYSLPIVAEAARLTKEEWPHAVPSHWPVSSAASAFADVTIALMAPSPAAPYDPMSDDIMQREDKDLKSLFGEYHGFSIHVENVNHDDIKAGKAVTARVLFTRDADTAAKRSDAFFATLAEKAGSILYGQPFEIAHCRTSR